MAITTGYFRSGSNRGGRSRNPCTRAPSAPVRPEILQRGKFHFLKQLTVESGQRPGFPAGGGHRVQLAGLVRVGADEHQPAAVGGHPQPGDVARAGQPLHPAGGEIDGADAGAALVPRGEEQAAAVRVPGKLDDGAVQAGGEETALAGPAIHDREAFGVRLVAGLGHGDVRQVAPVRRVTRLPVQGRVRRETLRVAAGQRDAVQVEVRAQRRFRRGDADVAQLGALGGEVEVVPAGQRDGRRVEVAGGQVAHRAASQLHMEDVVAGVAEPGVPLPVQQPVDGPGGALGQFLLIGILRSRPPFRHFAHHANQPAAVGQPER